MRIFAYLSLLVVIPLCDARASDILSPQKRMVTVDLARTLLTAKSTELSAEEIAQKNPFNPVQPAIAIQPQGVVASGAVQGLSGHDLLVKLAERVTPSGTMKFGDVHLLLFGQKKIKVGATIPIVFQGITYELQVTSIERISYALRLNNEEIIRPIKNISK